MAATLSIGAAALMLGVCVNTVRAWHTSGFLVPVYRTEGGHRRYDPSDVAKVMQRDVSEKPRVTVAYARVSTHDQKKDLGTQG
jgi:predicted site-specific integrase-resolvase